MTKIAIIINFYNYSFYTIEMERVKTITKKLLEETQKADERALDLNQQLEDIKQKLEEVYFLWFYFTNIVKLFRYHYDIIFNIYGGNSQKRDCVPSELNKF